MGRLPAPESPRRTAVRRQWIRWLPFVWVRYSLLRRLPLHASVLERFLAPAVLQYDEMKPYRPDALRDHVDTKQYYGESPTTTPS